MSEEIFVTEVKLNRKERALVARKSKTSAVYLLLEKFYWEAEEVAGIMNVRKSTVWAHKARAMEILGVKGER